jgi:DNA-binding PadR family transcriptional regulator
MFHRHPHTHHGHTHHGHTHHGHTHHGHTHHGDRAARPDHGFDDRHFGHGRHGRGGGRGGLGRFFAHGDLRLVILNLIAEKPRHGYEIIKAIEEQAGGTYSPSPGVIYPTLTLLEELGHVTVSPGEGGKKQHAITAEGKAFLDANRPAMEALVARMAEASRTYGSGPAPQILRAMENLKLALRMRLARGPLDDTQINAVAAVLDAAATSVERS